MGKQTEQFFEELGERGHEPRLENARGTVRFDVANGKKTATWFVAIDKGDLTVARSGGAADCTLSAGSALFDELVSGKASAVAAVLRGTLAIEGDWRLLVLVRRLLPGGPVSEQPTTPRAGRSRR